MTTYYANKELPGQPFTLYDTDHVTVVPLASGGAWTGKVEIIRVSNQHLVVTQTTFITLADTVPNFTRTSWDAATLTAIVADMGTDTTVDYIEHPVIVRVADGKDEGIGSDDPVVHTFKAVPV
jgi:hypothetical protein